MKTLDTPRTIDPAKAFEALVDWFGNFPAPGLLVGLSGTDSLVAFCAAAQALEKAGKGHRMMGVHFAPSEDFLYDHPEAEVHLWFANEVVPWLRNKFPNAKIAIDTSIDWRADGQRWGALMDLSVVSNEKTRQMRLPEEQYWVVGTRNRTEETLINYSNVSTAVSLQPLIHLWKSEILQLSKYLGVPQIAVTKSCETDCICGRMRLLAQHIPEVDMLLMARRGELSWEYVEKTISLDLQKQLTSFIRVQIDKGKFKKNIPYTPNAYVFEFEMGTLELKKFNHHNHMYIAFHYLKELSFDEAVERYGKYLKPILDVAGQSHRFNMELTRKYFSQLAKHMKECPTDHFEDLVEIRPSVLDKISA